jgi:hypothetical protein
VRLEGLGQLKTPVTSSGISQLTTLPRTYIYMYVVVYVYNVCHIKINFVVTRKKCTNEKIICPVVTNSVQCISLSHLR